MSPTETHLQNFSGVARTKSVRLKWSTFSELNVAGFNIWRSTARNGTYEKLNVNLIPSANPGQLTGSNYVYRDKTVLPGTKYFYKLEVVGGTSTLEWSQIVRVRMPATP